MQEPVLLGKGAACRVFAHGENARKEFRPDRNHTKSDVQVYMQHEIQCLRKCKACPHIVDVTRVWPCHTKFTMPRLECTLYDRLCADRDNLAFLPKLLRDMALALACLEENRIVHFDVKPDNIMLRGGDFVLIDFGRAELIDDDEGVIPDQHDPPYGALATSSPEVLKILTREWEGKEPTAYYFVDHRSDIYSLGMVLFWCVIGKWANDDRVAVVRPKMVLGEEENTAVPAIEPTPLSVVRRMHDKARSRPSTWPVERALWLHRTNGQHRTLLEVVVNWMVPYATVGRLFPSDLVARLNKKIR
jgi:serine/threonine protein kinase